MVNRGDVIENLLTGEKVIFLETSEDTNGELLRFEYVLPPRFSVPEHIHPRQEERHEILSGILRGRAGGREQDFREGERAVGPPGVPHAWRNPSEDEELRTVSERRPALHMEALLEVGFGIARDLKTDKKGIPKHLLRMMVLANEAKSDFYFTGAPRPVRKAFSALSGALAYAGKRLGYGGFESGSKTPLTTPPASRSPAAARLPHRPR
jgi:mannose-6-phosphate isomerase-like protein (cupin superfamily)